MDWQAVAAAPERIALAQALVELTPRLGWGRAALEAASATVFGDAWRWRAWFPAGSREAIWFISQVSDARMRTAFSARPAADMAEVIGVRFAQNSDLKPFVRQVMRFDVMHPVQALGRMQRTARAMVACVAPDARPGWLRLAWLNISYTALVFVWLFDATPGDQRTTRLTQLTVRWLGL